MITITISVTCPTCGGKCPTTQGDGTNLDDCPTCNGATTVVDAKKSQALRTVAEWAARERRSKWCPDCTLWDAHADDCPHVLAKGVLA